jgi:hypothetical protein
MLFLPSICAATDPAGERMNTEQASLTVILSSYMGEGVGGGLLYLMACRNQITEPARFQCLTSRGTRKCGSSIEMDGGVADGLLVAV